MEIEAIRAGFAARMHELCDELGIPRGHGRNTKLAQRCKVTANGARKWLLGLAYPEMPLAVQMCEAAGVNVLWLLQGTPPKKVGSSNEPAAHLAEAILAMPEEQRNSVLDFMRYQLTQTGQWFTSEALKSYVADLDAIRRPAEVTSGKPRTGTA